MSDFRLNLLIPEKNSCNLNSTEVLILIGAAWDTYQNGYLTLSEFRKVMFRYNNYMEQLAGELNNG